MRRLLARYGAGPLHLIGYPLVLAVIALAVRGWFDAGSPDTLHILVWFGAAVVAHDLVLLPLYSGLDRVLPRRAVAYVRVPALLSGLLLLVFFPLILRHRPAAYHQATSLSPDVYLSRWLIATAALFVLSALAYAVGAARSRS